MFHVEVRQFPNVGRSFNLSASELEQRVVAPWLAGRAVELSEKQFSPAKAKLTIYEGPRLRPEEMGLGRGWANVTRTGEVVTERVLAERRQAASAPVDRLKDEVVERAAGPGLLVCDVLALVSERYPGWRVSERLSLAERAVWELLHAGAVRLLDGSASEIPADRWEPVLLREESWFPGSALGLRAHIRP